jgi:hypothetical protein
MAVVAATMVCASTASASGQSTHHSWSTAAAASATSVTSADDPSPVTPSANLDEINRTKSGRARTTDPLPLDITGTADLQAQIDSVAAVVSKSPVPDGGLKWDVDRKEVSSQACWSRRRNVIGRGGTEGIGPGSG